MTVPVLTFFNNKGGVGKTSLVYHLAWILTQPPLNKRVLACDLDPQANLTTAFLDEDQLVALWDSNDGGKTVYDCVAPLRKTGDLLEPRLQHISSTLGLIPGDLALSGFEDALSEAWPKALSPDDRWRPFRHLTAFSTLMQTAAAEMKATLILADVGPNLGAINRSALIATDIVVVPLNADLFSLQGLRNLGPALQRWRKQWQLRHKSWPAPEFALPGGAMKPIGYVVHQHSVRLNRPVKAYDRWINRMPQAYAEALLDKKAGPYPEKPDDDENCLATMKHFRSLVPLAQDARKPVFDLTVADGAIGSHAAAVRQARRDYLALARRILERIQG